MANEYSRSLEREVKIMLTEDEFERVLNTFEWEDSVEQTNYYYMDSEGKLAAEHINVRVREKNGAYSLQVKSLVKNIDGGPSVHNEVEMKIDCLPDKIDAGIVKEMTGTETSGVNMVGSLVTHRHICHRGDTGNIEVCLDKSNYLGLTDYELELEYTGEALEQVMELAKALGLNTHRRPQGKMSRFYRRYKMINEK